jgi:rfaE bifunctional protein kinase chain/domain
VEVLTIINKEPYSLSSIQQVVNPLTRAQVEDILQRISTLNIGVVGDGCLDIYWHADMRISELSRETPHHNLPITREVYSPGAAGNVAVNFHKLNCANVHICSVFGSDWRGVMLKEKLSEYRIDYSYSHTDSERYTPTYCKTILHGLQGVQQEDKRLDFVNRTQLSESVSSQIARAVDRMAEQVDVISVVDQVDCGVIDAEVLKRLQYWSSQGKRIIVDSRNRIEWFQGLIVKPNVVELLRSYHGNSYYNDQENEEEVIKAGLQLSKQVGNHCCITLGDHGAVWIQDGKCTYVPTQPVGPPLDLIGAGDTFNAALLSALGAGCSGEEAVAFSHLAAAVSVRTLGGVGTASPEQILKRFDELNEGGWIYAGRTI